MDNIQMQLAILFIKLIIQGFLLISACYFLNKNSTENIHFCYIHTSVVWKQQHVYTPTPLFPHILPTFHLPSLITSRVSHVPRDDIIMITTAMTVLWGQFFVSIDKIMYFFWNQSGKHEKKKSELNITETRYKLAHSFIMINLYMFASTYMKVCIIVSGYFGKTLPKNGLLYAELFFSETYSKLCFSSCLS